MGQWRILFSATAAKRSRGDVLGRESVLSCDRLTVCPNSLKSNYSHIFTRATMPSEYVMTEGKSL